MDNKSHSSIPQGLRNQEGSFKADPLEKEEKFKSNANSRLINSPTVKISEIIFTGKISVLAVI